MVKHAAFVSLLLLSATMAQAQHSSHIHSHEVLAAQTETLPTEGGQGAFNAIAEIVALLNANPETNWETVDIDALHTHLLDMQRLTLDTQISTNSLPLGAEFTIVASGEALSSARRMVSAHAPFLQRATGWQASVEIDQNVTRLVVTSDNDEDAIRIQALGFYGLMATDAHHQEHHLAIATGQGDH